MSLGAIGQIGNAIAPNPYAQNAAAQNAYPNPFAQFAQQKEAMYPFTVEKIENGFIVHHGGKKYMCEDLDSAMDRAKACIVTSRLED